MQTAMKCIFFCRSKFTSYVTRQYQQQLYTPNAVRIPEGQYTYTISLFKFTMTQKVYFKVQSHLGSKIEFYLARSQIKVGSIKCRCKYNGIRFNCQLYTEKSILQNAYCNEWYIFVQIKVYLLSYQTISATIIHPTCSTHS